MRERALPAVYSNTRRATCHSRVDRAETLQALSPHAWSLSGGDEWQASRAGRFKPYKAECVPTPRTLYQYKMANNKSHLFVVLYNDAFQ